MPLPPLVLPPLPPPRVELPPLRRNRFTGWLSLIAHIVLILVVVELTRDATFWEEDSRSGSPGAAAGGGGGGREVSLIRLPAPPPAPPPVAVRIAAPRVTPPVPVPVPPVAVTPEPVVVAPAAPDTTPHPPATAPATGSGGGTGGSAGTGAGPGSGAGTGPGRGAPGPAPAPDSTRGGVRPPEPRQVIMPPFDYPRTMRGITVDVNFFVLADGRVDRVVFVPELPDRSFAKKLEDRMRAYRFRPARTPDGQAVAGIAVVRVFF